MFCSAHLDNLCADHREDRCAILVGNKDTQAVLVDLGETVPFTQPVECCPILTRHFQPLVTRNPSLGKGQAIAQRDHLLTFGVGHENRDGISDIDAHIQTAQNACILRIQRTAEIGCPVVAIITVDTAGLTGNRRPDGQDNTRQQIKLEQVATRKTCNFGVSQCEEARAQPALIAGA